MPEASGPRLTVERRPGWIVLRGRIDETAHLADLAVDGAVDGALDIDLGGVAYINSLGVRDWSALLKRFAQRGVAVTLHRCSEPMIQQMNMILDAKGVAEIESFHAPFTCDACGWEGSLVLTTGEVEPVVVAGRSPVGPCPDCGATARFNDFIDRYFLFLRG